MLPGKWYLLRLINAALNDELFFSIANHTLTVVDVDASYVKPFHTDIVLITPGQTTNVLLRAEPDAGCAAATHLMLARPYGTGQPGTFDNTTVAAVLEYAPAAAAGHIKSLPLFRPSLPALNDTAFAANYSARLRSLATPEFPATVPRAVDRSFFFAVGLGTNPCPANQTCQGPTNRTKFTASMNNVSFTMPTTALLQAHYDNIAGVYTADFPVAPLEPFNYTGTTPNNTNVSSGTKVVVLEYNTSVEVVLQGTSVLGAESHPLHLHGFDFFVVGQGFGNYDSSKDPAKFNLDDPVQRNTVGVPSGGWVAIRFFADNPGACSELS